MKYTKYNGGVAADCFSGPQVATVLSKAADYTLSDAEKRFVVEATFTAASKALVADLEEGQSIIVVNAGGTNAFTLKNLSGDTGTSVGVGKAALLRASRTANASVITILTDGT